MARHKLTDADRAKGRRVRKERIRKYGKGYTPMLSRHLRRQKRKR